MAEAKRPIVTGAVQVTMAGAAGGGMRGDAATDIQDLRAAMALEQRAGVAEGRRSGVEVIAAGVMITGSAAIGIGRDIGRLEPGEVDRECTVLAGMSGAPAVNGLATTAEAADSVLPGAAAMLEGPVMASRVGIPGTDSAGPIARVRREAVRGTGN